MMEPLKLTNPDVDAKFECTTDFERVVAIPGIYRGLLSNVTLDGANAMVAQGHPALKPKTEASEKPNRNFKRINTAE
jgi:hypothetical protein